MTALFAPKDDLMQFAEWWTQRRIVKPPLDGFAKVGTNTCVTLFREGRFQVQLFTCEPNTEIPDHRHPNVRSFVMYVTGDVYFRKNAQQIITDDMIKTREDGAPALLGIIGRVDPEDWHGAAIGPRGGCFIGIEEWLNGAEPSSVHLDWEGPAIDEAHANELGGPH